MPELNLYDKNWPIWSYQEQLPPAKFIPDPNGVNGVVHNTIVSGGCIVAGSYLSYSVLFSNVRIGSFSHLEKVIALPEVEIGEGCRLRNVVIDRGCKIPNGLNVGDNPDLDAQRFHRTSTGVVLITEDMLKNLN
jgi:glucose-1-phosphate adenylyltransferase